jgi:hypothetical protein
MYRLSARCVVVVANSHGEASSRPQFVLLQERMMFKTMLLTVVLGLLCLFQIPGLAQGPGARQQYSGWQYNQDKGYHYRKYEYKAAPNDKQYKHEYVIYYKQDPKKKVPDTWVYYYNPTTEKFWARYPTTNHPKYGEDAKAGKEVWSVLPPEHRKKDIYQIDQKQFPEPKANYCPPVPSCKDNCNLMSPPADLP